MSYRDCIVKQEVAYLSKTSCYANATPYFSTIDNVGQWHCWFFEKDDFVYYLHNGSPIYCHQKDDVNSYRYITANLVVTKLCSPSELARSLGVNNRNIQRYAKALREKGSDWFFHREAKGGDAHKLTAEKLQQAQQMLDDSYAVAETARLLGVTEGALRYHLRKGRLKKNA